MAYDESERPAKRTKFETSDNRPTKSGPKGQNRPEKAGEAGQPLSKKKGRHYVAFSASGIQSNDVGIFVTSDKGKERQCAQDLVDLLGEHIDDRGDGSVAKEDQAASADTDEEVDIEADIQAELDSLKPQPKSSSSVAPEKLTVVSLDIPCVSFLRFPSSKSSTRSLDPVEIVRKLCTSAADKNFQGPRSRYIKRLTPITLIRKTLNDGLDSLCDEVLPPHFQIEDDEESKTGADEEAPKSQPKTWKFAIRPTIRNNNKIDRDQVIQTVAQKINALGKNKHSVNLKGYDKLVLVDVYRNVVGMSVVGNEFETFKRFNLAEIHASHFTDQPEGQPEEKEAKED